MYKYICIYIYIHIYTYIHIYRCDSMTFSTQDRDLVSILEDLQNIGFTGHNSSTETSRLNDCFWSEKINCV